MLYYSQDKRKVKINMYNDYKILSLLGYAIVLNNEMHSRQIKWLERIISDNNLENYREIIYDVLNDKDEKISVSDAWYSYEMLYDNDKVDIYSWCYQLILVGHDNFDDSEINSEEKSFLDRLASVIRGVGISNIRKKARDVINYNKKTILDSRQRNNFSLDLNRVNLIAHDDFENLNDITKRILSDCDLLRKKLRNVADEVSNQKLRDALLEFQNGFGEKVFESVKQIKNSIPQKELASKNFSLALMGRTKAGKSTLHAIMCGEGYEFIGTGGQRTTRFNRVFSWNGLKIIDTPGIGAGEADGYKDTEIARSVIGQADIICFVVVDDTISDDILSTLDMIAEYHKPMIVILNHKDDINKKSHLKKFMENPTDWRCTTEEKNLGGWIERLRRNAKKNGYQDILSVVPVFLLAAYKGIMENDNVVYEGSNYQELINEIKNRIEKNCLIYKSQTMLDEPSIQLHKAMESFIQEENKLYILKDKIDKIKERTIKRLVSLQTEIRNYISVDIDDKFDDFYTMETAAFVDENSKKKAVDLVKVSYEQHFKKSGVEKEITSSIDKCINEYHNKLNDNLKELEEEIRYASLNVSGVFNINGYNTNMQIKSTFPIKGIIKVLSMGLDVAACFFPVLGFVSIPLAVVGGFFKSKKQKESENWRRTRDAFKAMIEEHKKQVKKDVEKAVNEVLVKDKYNLEQNFEILLSQIKEILNYINSSLEVYKFGLRQIDTCYAIRILEFITEDSESYLFSKDNVISYRNLERNEFEIRTKYGKVFNTYKIKEITGEQVIVKRYI